MTPSEIFWFVKNVITPVLKSMLYSPFASGVSVTRVNLVLLLTLSLPNIAKNSDCVIGVLFKVPVVLKLPYASSPKLTIIGGLKIIPD